ncbi:MAG TPA: hypothetical protein DIW54_10905 [Chitinophagaceae bacterium]|nr:hypothetical protein [Chitinophagaceae bacterium]
MTLEQGFLKDCIKRFKAYKELGDKTFEQLQDADFFFRPSPESNSIAIIIQHMYGNMMSRWTNFLTEDGEKPWRKRDAEFESMDCSKADLISFWETGWHTVLTTLESLEPEDLMKTVTIRTEPHLVYDVLLRQLAHYPYHIGQILYIGKIVRDKDWKSLSIPKGGSDAYLQQMQEQHQQKP